MSRRHVPGLLTAIVLASSGCSTIHGDDMDGAIGKTAQGFGSLLESIGGELRTRIWQRSDSTAPTSVPASHTTPAPGQ
jgi:hypothetical protein